MSETEKPGLSRRDFLRAAGTLGISGGLLGAYASRARGHDGEDHGHDVAQAATEHSSHGGNGTVGNVGTARFDPTGFLRDFYWGEERRETGSSGSTSWRPKTSRSRWRLALTIRRGPTTGRYRDQP